MGEEAALSEGACQGGVRVLPRDGPHPGANQIRLVFAGNDMVDLPYFQGHYSAPRKFRRIVLICRGALPPAISQETNPNPSKSTQGKHSKDSLQEGADSRYLLAATPKGAPGGSRLSTTLVLPCVLPRGGPLRGRLSRGHACFTEGRPPSGGESGGAGF